MTRGQLRVFRHSPSPSWRSAVPAPSFGKVAHRVWRRGIEVLTAGLATHGRRLRPPDRCLLSGWQTEPFDWDVASVHGCDDRTWMKLARAGEADDPIDAIPILEPLCDGV